MLSLRKTLLLGLACAIPARMHAQRGDTIAARELAPGVAYRQFTDTRGPWSMYLVRVDLRRANLEIRDSRAADQLKGRERVSDMVRRINTTGVRVLAAVNGDFFDLKSGENENNQVIAGEWWKGLRSPTRRTTRMTTPMFSSGWMLRDGR